jgi:hypothetical protein
LQRISNSKRFQAAVDAIVDDFTAVPYTGGIEEPLHQY